MRTKVSIIALFLGLFAATLSAQNAATMYFMDEIAERNNMNPAFTPNCAFYFDFVALPNFYLNAGTNSIAVRDLLFNKNGKTSFMLENDQFKEAFYKKLRPTVAADVQFQLNILAFGFKVRQHYFTFDFGLRADVNAYIPRDVFKLALYGTPDVYGVNKYNFSSLGADVDVYSDVAIGYMNRVNDRLTVGAKAKFLMGYANVSTDIRSLSLSASHENWTLQSNARINASLPLEIQKDEDGNLGFNPFETTYYYSDMLLKPAGYGAAIDLGFTYKPIKDLTVSAAITDLGFIHWNRNLCSGSMVNNVVFDGIIDYDTSNGDIEQESNAIVDRLTTLGNDVINSIEFDETGQSYSSMIYATFSVGAEYGFVDNKISFGLLNRARFNQHHIFDELTFSANFRPADWLKFAVSYSFLNGRWGTLGLGMNLRVGMFNMYLIADYLPVSWAQVNYTSEEANQKIPLPYSMQCFNLQAGMAWNIHRFSSDRDGDGVRNRKDRCPDTDMDFLRKKCPDLKKNKQFVDKQGCPLDADNDGVHDCYDLCPNTPAGVPVDENGCPFDTDHDGVLDYLDNCPETPVGVEVDAHGCPVDGDKDGVPDYLDTCPETPRGVEVDDHGCPVDGDGDGVPDYLDFCPKTPAGVEVDEHGCPVDADADGVPDYKDHCPNTPKGISVDERGCPIDTDGDGVPDDVDKCPNTPGTASNDGCPEVKREVRSLFKKAMNGIQFETGKDVIKKVSFPILDDIVKVLNENPEYNLTIKGHTDNVGNPESNLILSEKRAASVRKYMIDKGIDADRLESFGYGQDMPVADNKTEAGRRLNRRVEFEVEFETVEYQTVRQTSDDGAAEVIVE